MSPKTPCRWKEGSPSYWRPQQLQSQGSSWLCPRDWQCSHLASSWAALQGQILDLGTELLGTPPPSTDIPYGHQLVSYLLHFPSSSLLIHQGGQWRMTQVLGPLYPSSALDEAPSFSLALGSQESELTHGRVFSHPATLPLINH